MVTLLFADTAPYEEAAFTEHYLSAMDAHRRSKATAYKPEHDKRLNIAAGCLLQVGVRLAEKGLDTDLITTGEDGIASLSYDDFLVLYEPVSLSYTTGEYGKPAFAKGAKSPFSLSHSKDAAAIAIGDVEVGVDVQHHRPTHFDRLAKRFFAAEEIAFLQRVIAGKERIPDGSSPQDVFHDLWAAKEAYVKLTGDGLFLPFEDFTVRLTYAPNAPLRGVVEAKTGEEAQLIYPVAVNDYSYCLCTRKEEQVNVLRVDFPAARA